MQRQCKGGMRGAVRTMLSGIGAHRSTGIGACVSGDDRLINDSKGMKRGAHAARDDPMHRALLLFVVLAVAACGATDGETLADGAQELTEAPWKPATADYAN